MAQITQEIADISNRSGSDQRRPPPQVHAGGDGASRSSSSNHSNDPCYSQRAVAPEDDRRLDELWQQLAKLRRPPNADFKANDGSGGGLTATALPSQFQSNVLLHTNCVLNPFYRNRGYGRQMLNAAIDWAQQQYVADDTQTFPDSLTMTVFRWNKVALRSLQRVPALRFSGVRRGKLGGDCFQFRASLNHS